MARFPTDAPLERVIKAFHLTFPFTLSHQWTGTNDENGFDFPPSLQLPQNQAGLNGLADADAIGDQQSRTVGPDESQHGPELVGNEVNASRVERIQGREAGMPYLQGGQGRMKLLTRKKLKVVIGLLFGLQLRGVIRLCVSTHKDLKSGLWSAR